MRILEAHDTADGDGLIIRVEQESSGLPGAIQTLPVKMPPSCARCLAPSTQTATSQGVGAASGFVPRARRKVQIEVPYCDRCLRKDKAEGRRAALVLLAAVLPLTGLAFWGVSAIDSGWRILLLALAVLGTGAVLAGLSILANPLRSGSAVRMVVDGAVGSIHLHFRSRAYGEAFVAAHGGVTPADAAATS